MKKTLKLHSLSLKERDRRWRRVREAMKAQGLDCLIIWGSNASWDAKMSNVRYMTQIGGNGEQAFVIFPLRDDLTCFTSFPWIADWWTMAQDWIKDIRPRHISWSVSVEKRLKELGLEKGNIGVVGLAGLCDHDGWLTYETYTQILNQLPQANFINATTLMEEIRMIKSPEEIECLERAGELGDMMWDTLVRTAKPGVKERQVYAKMLEVMISNGGEYPTLLLWGAGPEPFAHPFFLVTNRTLKEGDLISVEMHPKYIGYLCHQERSICLGVPRREYRHMYDVALQCFSQAFKMLTPGVRVDDLVKAIREPICAESLSYVEAGIQGHGLESPEYPTLQSPSEKAPMKMGDFKLKAGMVLALTIDLIDPNWKGGNTGVMLADTVLVTETGGRRLSKYELDLLTIR